jgi:excisionase family DNA binding protein
MNETPWLTTEEAARYLKIKPRTLLVWVRAGLVTGHAIGTRRKVWRFLREELDRDLCAGLQSVWLTAASTERPM